jgi:nitrous oxidase accessory protein
MLRANAGRLRRWLAVAALASIPVLAAAPTVGQAGAPDLVVCPACDETSLAAALATAAPGATIEVRGGVYPGGLVIERPVQLIGVDQPVIDGGGAGTLVTIRNTEATLSGFDLRGTGDNLDHEDAAVVVENATAIVTDNRIEDALFGIYLKQAPDTVLRGNVILSKDVPTPRKGDGIKTWYSDRVVIEDNQASDSRDIILWYSNDGIVRNNTFDRGRYGLHLMFSDRATIEGNSMSANSIGLYIMYSRDPKVVGNRIVNNHGPSGGGIGLKDVDGAIIDSNRFVNNQIALQVDNSPREFGIENYIRGNVFAYNHAGIGFMPSVKHNTVTGNAFIDNTEHVAIIGRGQLQEITWAENGQGNYWSDYAGYDANGDGVGDIPYQSQRLFETLVDQHPLLRFFTWTPAASAVDFAARAMPTVRPEMKLADPAPLMAPVAHPALPPLVAERGENRLALAASGFVLVGAALAGYLSLRRPAARLRRRRLAATTMIEAAS